MRDVSNRGALMRAPPVFFAALLSWIAPGWCAVPDATEPVAGRTAAESSPPSWPRQIEAPKDAPNVLLILTDDVGFGSSSTFGGPVPTPTFDALAAQGLRYNRFHTTALCSPTRASLLTGRTPHDVNMGHTTNWATGYRGYTGIIPPSAATVAALLRANGWSTAMFGKAHFTPEWEMSPSGPFYRWPTGLGFQYFYGFLGADMNQFAPVLTENTTAIEPARGRRDYFLETDLADKAIAWVREQDTLAPAKPLFVYFATGAAHAPNQAPAEWLAKFRGRFDGGWDALQREIYQREKKLGVIPRDAALAMRPATLPAWDTLPPERRKLYARFMEAYAAALAHADHQIGRVVDAFRETGRLDNTLVIYIQGDNGASAEGRMHGRVYEQSGINGFDEPLEYMTSRIEDIGGSTTYPLVTGGWAWAMNAPFQWSKRVASHLGGTRNGMVIAWPRRIHQHGLVLDQFHHVSDIAPTILDAAGVDAPASFNGVAQQPIDGISMSYTFDDPRAAPRRTRQVFEVFENLALYDEGWMASTRPTSTFWDTTPSAPVPLDRRTWELYDLGKDFSQVHDLAAANPRQLAHLQELFWSEAARHHILPIHGQTEGRAGMPSLAAGRTSFTYRSGMENISEGAAPPLIGRGFSIAVDAKIPAGGAAGVLVTQGGRFGGYALYVADGRLAFHYNAIGPVQFTLRGAQPLPAGEHELAMRLQPDSAQAGAGGTVTLALDGHEIARAHLERTLKTWISHTEGLDIGIDHGTAINDEYAVESSRFSGIIDKVVFTLDPGPRDGGSDR
jgi:arylsulfatase A-like enzyme